MRDVQRAPRRLSIIGADSPDALLPKVLVLGASGIIGQWLYVMEPTGYYDVTYTARQTQGWPWLVARFIQGAVDGMLDDLDPDIIINLIGENSVDTVEHDASKYAYVNEVLPGQLARWCESRGRWLVHVSSQAVFDGEGAPYTATYDLRQSDPVNQYGLQKKYGEFTAMGARTMIARLTFVLGIRPFPHLGRENPLEQMLARPQGSIQVSDRYFSPCFAGDAAALLWEMCGTITQTLPETLERWLQRKQVFHLGLPLRMSRADIATVAWAEQRARQDKADGDVQIPIRRVKHSDAFPNLAQRPLDTTFAEDALFRTKFAPAMEESVIMYERRCDAQSMRDRALELSLFFNIPEGQAYTRLLRPFGVHHAAVAADFKVAAPTTDEALLEWYRQTHEYIWELTAYHLNEGFNYSGMMQGITERLLQEKATGSPMQQISWPVLVLGDGVGDLSMALFDAGLDAIYHDLDGSKTAELAQWRALRRYGVKEEGQKSIRTALSQSWAPPKLAYQPEAILALDFFEHMPNVEEWIDWVYNALVPGGLFVAQNAFAIGDAEHGDSIPMHLSRNNRFEQDWDPLLEKYGFIREAGDWRRKPR